MTLSPSSTDPSAWFEMALASLPDRLLIDAIGSRSFTYGEANNLRFGCSRRCALTGSRPGDRVAVQAEKSAEARISDGSFDPSPFPAYASHAARMLEIPAVQRVLERARALRSCYTNLAR